MKVSTVEVICMSFVGSYFCIICFIVIILIIGPQHQHHRVVKRSDGVYAAQSSWPFIFWTTTTTGTLGEARARVSMERTYTREWFLPVEVVE